MAYAPLTYNEEHTVFAAFKDHWAWLLALGVAFVLLGAIGVAAAVLLTIVSVVLFGTLLAAAAVLQLVETVRATGWRARWPHLAVAVIYATGAAIMVIDPVDASVGLTLVLAVLLLAVGVLRENWTNLRTQWEYSHAASAVLNLGALVAVIRSVLARDR